MEKREGFLKEAMMIAVPVALQAMLQSSFSMIDQFLKDDEEQKKERVRKHNITR
ncbi:hypothetical protein [Streptococcus equinus]|uniref:hypothetical protein n=1 Tax=Streptococcus equinus TaxID=1335 RepID=UPI0012F8C656|nr:hypothetical protein [Streptococcus equinus]QGX45255.1 hypothetical protein GO596_08070 [Streptococcus equinus]